MSKKKADGSIFVPTLNIEKKINPLYLELSDLLKKLENIDVYNSICVFSTLKALKSQKDKLRKKYEDTINYCHDQTIKPVSGPGITMCYMQTWSFSKGISALNKLQNIWNEINAIIDRKYAYSFAIVSI